MAPIWSILVPFYPFWSLLTLFGHFQALTVIRQVWNEYKTVTWHIWLKWGVYQVSTTKFREIYILVPFDLFWSLLTLFGHFWALPVTWEVWNIWKANRNMTFLIEIRGLPSFYDQRFVRYIFLLHWTPYGPIWSILVPFYPLLVPFDSKWEF